VAIASVVLFHTQMTLYHAFGGPLDKPPQISGRIVAVLNQGRFGVHLFFIISGFLLVLPFASNLLRAHREVRLRDYYLRRVTRLEPPYLIALSIFFVLSLVSPLWPATSHAGAHFGAGVVYSHYLAFGTVNPILAQTWSLEVEIQFYLLVPLLASVFRVEDPWLRRTSIVAIGLTGFIVEATVLTWIPQLSQTVVAYLPFFMAGFLVADLYLVEWDAALTPEWKWDVVSLVGWPLFFLGAATGSSFQTVALPWVGAALLISTLRGRWTRRALRNRWIVTIGGMCYSIYLIHYPLLEALTRIRPRLFGSSFSGLAALGHFILWAPVVALAGGLFFALVERPCMQPQWPARLRDRVLALVAPRGRLPVPVAESGADEIQTATLPIAEP
jgi:peptidoglycan/LPS O-acetylase OafA/YrhL